MTLRRLLLHRAFELGYGKYIGHLTSSLGWSRYETMASDLVELISSRGYVLDAGCGFGQLSEMLHSHGVEVVGLDISRRELWEYLEAQYICGDCRCLPFRSNIFSAVIGCGVIEHVCHETKFLRECNRILKEDGVFFCHHLPSVLSAERLGRILPLHYKHERYYTKDRIRELFESCGYSILEIKREYIVPVHVGCLSDAWNEKWRFLGRLDSILCKTPLEALASSWKVIALKA